MTFRPTLMCLIALTACARTEPDPRLGPGTTEQIKVAYAEAFRDTPFDDGTAIRIVAPDPDPVRAMETFALVPCRDGVAICGGTAHGPAGTVTAVGDRTRITGAYPGVEFYLDPAGSGYLARGGVNVPLAWD